MKNHFRMFLIGACAIACITVGRAALAVDKPAAPIPVTPKLDTQVKLAIVSGDNQTSLLAPPLVITSAGIPPPKGNLLPSPLLVKITNSDGKPIAHAPIVFTCHLWTGWTCQMSQDGNKTDTITVMTNESGIAQINAGSLYVSCSQSQWKAGISGPRTATGGWGPLPFTVTTAYGITPATGITSATFSMSLYYVIKGNGGVSGGESSAG